jgi:CheY-like chemotaxis protein
MSSRPIKLLIVDDESAVRSILAEIFVRMGHSVRSANDGFSALAEIRERVPDVVLSDLNMPGMSGFELLSVIRRRLPEIYVIATSGAYIGDDVPHGIAADAFHGKATGFVSLVELVAGARTDDERPRRGTNASLPIWISGTGEGGNDVMISCPHCLRAFPQQISATAGYVAHVTDCEYCQTPIHYAVVQPLDPGTSQPYRAVGDVGLMGRSLRRA